MGIVDMLLLGLGLAADAFAVSVCKGLSSKESSIKTGLVCGLWFGFFQALMPLLGWLLGTTVAEYISAYAPYVAFILLAYLGIKMLVDVIKERKEDGCRDCEKDASLKVGVMLTFAIATSIDALAAGLTIAAVDANVWIAILIIGVITLIASFIGAVLGRKIGGKGRTGAQIAGGVILILIGLKIVIEHLITVL